MTAVLDLFRKRYHPPGTAPGTLSPASRPDDRPAPVADVRYYRSEASLAPLETASLDARPSPGDWLWVHVQGIPSAELLEALGNRFRLHPLALEDVHNSGQRPKAEFYDDHCVVVLQQPLWDGHATQLQQVNLFIGPDWVISIHDGTDDPFDPIRQRLQNPGYTRNFSRLGAAYLGHALVDMVVDQAFPLLEALGERIEELEDQVLADPARDTQARIHALRREMLLLRRQLWPTRDALGRLLRDGDDLLNSGVRPYFRDVHDHVVHIMDLLESYREMTASLVDTYLTGVNHRLNEVMKVLTVIATIFIPLTFVVGVYGMNFENPDSPWAMPELATYYGYPAIWLVMVLLAGGMLYAFRRRGWF